MKDVTSLCAVEVMSDPAAVLFGLEDEFRVLLAERTGPDAIKVVVELTAGTGRARVVGWCRGWSNNDPLAC